MSGDPSSMPGSTWQWMSTTCTFYPRSRLDWPRMSAYKQGPLDFSKLKTVPLKGRAAKVSVKDFARPYNGGDVAKFVDSLPRILGAEQLRRLAAAIRAGKRRKRALIWGLGGDVIKGGLAPVLIDLMRRGFVTAFALNGAAAIHDLEIALF